MAARRRRGFGSENEDICCCSVMGEAKVFFLAPSEDSAGAGDGVLTRGDGNGGDGDRD